MDEIGLPVAILTAEIKNTHYQTTLKAGGHTLLADEPEDLKGTDTGMNPDSLLLASLGSCTAITLRMYSDRKQWIVDEIVVTLELYRTREITLINRKISFIGSVTAEQHTRLLQIANACPVHQVLTGKIEIKTS